MVEYNNHLKIGSVSVVHKNKMVVTNLSNRDFELFLKNMDDFAFDVGHIPPGYEHRADLISDLFYNTPSLDWLICWYNGIDDPFQQLNILDEIKIPRVI
jgi:hypothetical protein